MPEESIMTPTPFFCKSAKPRRQKNRGDNICLQVHVKTECIPLTDRWLSICILFFSPTNVVTLIQSKPSCANLFKKWWSSVWFKFNRTVYLLLTSTWLHLIVASSHQPTGWQLWTFKSSPQILDKFRAGSSEGSSDLLTICESLNCKEKW